MIPDMDTNGFVVAGTCTEQLYGMCESMWRQGKIVTRNVVSMEMVFTFASQEWRLRSYSRQFLNVYSQVW
jgi:hypothetical protein